MKLSNTAILIFIIIVASILRLYHLFEIPFTYDEFSALQRTHFDTFAELIEKGVKIDGHPAGVQVFLFYWTRLWGYTEWIVKLPFIISGILSVLLIYLIGRQWYNETLGLISAAFLASIQFSIMYSQIARPYISGLFFSLLMVYYWSKLMLRPRKRFYMNASLFVISAALCAYNHHFSLLFAAIVGFSGLFFIQRKYLLKYIVSGVIIFLLYIPHINIFFYQLHIGGVENWLGKPHPDFFINYISYIFDFSTIGYVLAILLILYGFLKFKKQDIQYKKMLLFAAWFFLPFIIGFIYSRYFSSVLQYSVLIFSFPFLFFILFGHIKTQKPIINLIIVLAILSINIYSVIKIREHYRLFYDSPFKKIITDQKKAADSHKNTASIIDSNKGISEYYIQKTGSDTNFIWYESVNTIKDLKLFLEKQSQIEDYLYLGCLSNNNPLSVPVIEDYFPAMEWQNNYAGGTTYLFSKYGKKDEQIIDSLGFESGKEKEYWSPPDRTKIVDSVSYSGNSSFLFDNKTEYGPSYTRPLNEIISNENNFIDISVEVLLPDKFDDILLVSSLDTKDKNIYWGATSFDKFVVSDSVSTKRWIRMHHSIKLSDIYLNYSGIILKVYIWNKGLQNFYIDDFKISLRKGNPVIYGLFEKI